MHTVSGSHAGVSLSGVCAGYRSRSVLCDINLDVARGSCVAVVGPSGGGKTTLLRVVAGLIAPKRGQVRRPCLACGPEASIGYIPQNLGLVRNRSVLENVLLGAVARLPLWRSVLGIFARRDRERAAEALRSVGLAEKAHERVESLSGGERRRVAIARALVQEPALLLADEFLAEVDKVTAEEITQLLTQIRGRTGMTVILVDHDIEAACRMADRVVVMVGGRKVRELNPEQVRAMRLPDLFRPLAPAS